MPSSRGAGAAGREVCKSARAWPTHDERGAHVDKLQPPTSNPYSLNLRIIGVIEGDWKQLHQEQDNSNYGFTMTRNVALFVCPSDPVATTETVLVPILKKDPLGGE
jgi:hypothetical protein